MLCSAQTLPHSRLWEPLSEDEPHFDYTPRSILFTTRRLLMGRVAIMFAADGGT